MSMRSLLFVPGERPDRMHKALASGADALILDLEDAVAPTAKAGARKAVRDFLDRADRSCKIMVRINPLESGMTEDDLAAVLPGRPDGLVLPKVVGASSVQALLRLIGADAPPILPIATETAAAIFALGSFASCAGCLCGLTWGAEDLSSAVGASTAREADGSYTAPYQLARSLALFAASAAAIPAIDTVYPDFRDLDGLAAQVDRARRDGFTGMLAIHPAQVPIINRGFLPNAAEIDKANAIVAAFAAHPGAGAVQIDGRMLDAPHLAQARTILDRARG